MIGMDDFFASLILSIVSPVLVWTSVNRLSHANGNASLIEGFALISLATGGAFSGVYSVSHLLAPWTGAVLHEVPIWAPAAVYSGGAVLTWVSAKSGSKVKTVNVKRKRLRAWAIALSVPAIVWGAAALSDIPSPLDKRAVIFHGYEVPDVAYGGPISWRIDATIRRQCDANTRYTVRGAQSESVLPIWERSDRAGNAKAQPRRVFEITARETFVVQDPGHPHYLAPPPPGDYIFTAYRAQFCDGARFDYEPVRVPFKVLGVSK